jgi:K+-sensing histidine kinase KdpD
MQRLIESLLFAGQLQNNQMQLIMEPLNPASIVHSVANELKPIATNYHLNLNLNITQELQPVSSNRQALNHSLYNLLDVVIRSSHSEVIDVLVHHQIDDVMVTIRDDGERLPLNALNTVIKRLGRTSQPIKQIPGSAGLGLYVASVLSDSIGSNLQMQTSHGKRIISMSLPLSKQMSLSI